MFKSSPSPQPLFLDGRVAAKRRTETRERGERTKNKEIQMDTTNQNEPQILLQSTEAAPLEDRSLSANETLSAQQSEIAEETFMPTFIP